MFSRAPVWWVPGVMGAVTALPIHVHQGVDLLVLRVLLSLLAVSLCPAAGALIPCQGQFGWALPCRGGQCLCQVLVAELSPGCWGPLGPGVDPSGAVGTLPWPLPSAWPFSAPFLHSPAVPLCPSAAGPSCAPPAAPSVPVGAHPLTAPKLSAKPFLSPVIPTKSLKDNVHSKMYNPHFPYFLSASSLCSGSPPQPVSQSQSLSCRSVQRRPPAGRAGSSTGPGSGRGVPQPPGGRGPLLALPGAGGVRQRPALSPGCPTAPARPHSSPQAPSPCSRSRTSVPGAAAAHHRETLEILTSLISCPGNWA
ncbi:translation initiation factor IF-2-like [Serinus canaria]|uniref:translation initiation factor IF-2-like n=1 Tax=Serinus canaria TaxID=9135 RepID=UPI0021CCD211|nr:translation initiation factor IF-2-like [Serinus canaria]